MNSTKKRNIVICMLAYFHRYFYWVCVLAFTFCFGPDFALLRMGLGFLLFAVYSLLGYILRWKHIYCSYQNAYRQTMTPNHIVWSKIRKTDAYGCPAIFGVLGLGMVVCQFFV